MMKTYHWLFDVLLVIVATRSIVVAVNDLNSDVTFRETSAPFTCGDFERDFLTSILVKEAEKADKGK